MTADQTVAFRLQLRSSGFDPVGCIGKRPVETGWQQKVNLSEAELMVMPGANTGFNCRNTPALDADITDQDAAEAVERAVREWFEDHGRVVRIGKPPKRLIPFRTDEPFAKLSATFLAPNGEIQRIEILGDGQQALAHGTHPDTGTPYTWHGGCLGEVTRDELPEINGQEAQELLDYLSDMWRSSLGGNALKPPPGRATGSTQPSPTILPPGAQWTSQAELQALSDSKHINDVYCRILPEHAAKGMPPNDVLKFAVDEAMARIGDRLGWTREKEIKCVNKRIISEYRWFIRQHDLSAGIPSWLPGDFHKGWAERVEAGWRPDLGFNIGGFYMRTPQDRDRPKEHSASAQEAKPQGKSNVLCCACSCLGMRRPYHPGRGCTASITSAAQCR